MSNLQWTKKLADLIKKVQSLHTKGVYPETLKEAQLLGPGFWVLRKPGELPQEIVQEGPPAGIGGSTLLISGTAFFLEREDADSYSDALIETLMDNGSILFWEHEYLIQSN